MTRKIEKISTLLVFLSLSTVFNLFSDEPNDLTREEKHQILSKIQTIEGLSELLKIPLGVSEGENFTIWSSFSSKFNQEILDQVEKNIKNLSALLGDENLTDTFAHKTRFILLSSKQNYINFIELLVAINFLDAVSADLRKQVSGFSLRTNIGIWDIKLLDSQADKNFLKGFVSHVAVNHYIRHWKSPKRPKPLPPWLAIGTALIIDMNDENVGHGGYYEISYGKKDSEEDPYLKEYTRGDWIKLWKSASKSRQKENKPISFVEVFKTPFVKFTHEHRMIAWAACETLKKHSRKKKPGYLPQLIEACKNGGSAEEHVKEITKWSLKKFDSRVTKWLQAQKKS